MSKEREIWIDNIKVLACTLIVLGHFFQSMVKADIIPENCLYKWFNTTIYYFHVPLFFICSGYLYKKYQRGTGCQSWIINVHKKAIVLGLPYFIFSFVTWFLKTVFAGSVNDEVFGLAYSLFIHPISPYWFLYILFFIFLVTPMVDGEKIIIFMLIGMALKIIRIKFEGASLWKIYAIQGICSNEIWFVLGMMIAVIGSSQFIHRRIGVGLGIVFLLLSLKMISLKMIRIENGIYDFGMGLLACASIVMTMAGSAELFFLKWLSKYTMPIYLMHTMFAALLRVFLIKICIINIPIHIFLGIIISFIGPIMAMQIIDLMKLGWLIYPGRLLTR